MHVAQSSERDYALYNRSARRYDRIRFSGRAGQWGHQRQVAILRSLGDNWCNRRVLEVGCGTGRITERLVEWGATVTATDISTEMLDVARMRFEKREVSARPDFRVMSVSDIDADLQDYDYIVMVNVFGRLSAPEEALKCIAERMSSDCRLIFTFPCLTSVLWPFGMLVNVRTRSLSRAVTSRWHTPKAVEAYCAASGLQVKRFRGNHYVPVPRLLFWSLPLFRACDWLLASRFPILCPSVFVECKRFVS